MILCEVKRNKSKIRIPLLEHKAEDIDTQYSKCDIECQALSLDYM